MTTTLTLLAAMLAPAPQDQDVVILEQFVDTVIYENLAVTRVRLTIENRNPNQHRELGATIFAPPDAVAFEFDGYGTVQGDNQAAFAPERALTLYMQLTDAARRQGMNLEPITVADPQTAADKAIDKVRADMTQSTLSIASVTLVLSKSDEGITFQDYDDDIKRPPAEPELLQQVGPGEFQILVYPIPARSKQHVEMYFASGVQRREGTDTYAWEMPIELLAGAPIEERLVHVRVISGGEVNDLTCTTYKARDVTHQSGGKTDKTRRELRVSGNVFKRGDPIRVEYKLGEGSNPIDLASFDGAEPAWREFEKRDAESGDPVHQPGRAYAAMKTRHRIDGLLSDTKTPMFDREETATQWATEARIATPFSSLVLAEERLYKYIGEPVPANGKEIPYKSVRR